MGLILHGREVTLICDCCLSVLLADGTRKHFDEATDSELGRASRCPEQVIASAMDSGWREELSQTRWACPECQPHEMAPGRT